MGLMMSVIISYAGIREAIANFQHIRNGIPPQNDPDFRDLVAYYTSLQEKSANPGSLNDWKIQGGQAYLCLTEDKNGNLKSARISFYDDSSDSTAILFSTKISSFGQESIESNSSQSNGYYRSDSYTPKTTKTLVSNSVESFSVGNKNKSAPIYEHTSDATQTSEGSSECIKPNTEDNFETKEKLTWYYRPQNNSTTLPEIHFQSYDGDIKEENSYSEEFLRSLDGIKFRPLQRSDPSARRRSFKKRHSSSSNSSKDSRASREEELKMFTSLEQAEFERMNKNTSGYGSAPNLAVHSYSRSRSRESSKERKNESWSVEASIDSITDGDNGLELKPRLKDISKLDSFEEEKEETKDIVEEDEEVDFWGNLAD